MTKKIKRLGKHDLDSREYAILYINNEFVESSTHSGCIKKYLDSQDIEYGYNIYYRKDVQQTIDENELITEYAFLHYVDGEQTCQNENTGIYIDTSSIQGIALNDLVSKIQSQYPGVEIYDDNKILYEDIFKVEYEKIARLKKKYNL